VVKLYEDTNIKAIADAIRAKNGSTETYKTSEMAEAILSIQAGGNVDAIINRSIKEITSGVETVESYAFRACKSLTSVTFPNATTVNGYAFYDCNKLATINFPKATYLGSYAFYNCDRIASFVLPEVKQVGSYAFASCDGLQSADLPKATSLGNNSFYLCFILKSVMLRANTVCALSNVNAFTKCYRILGTVDANYNPNGLADGYIYVPAALVDSYKAHSVWSNFSTQIRALESYTVDGTTTGALDESKI
jgi:hypothetical protein